MRLRIDVRPRLQIAAAGDHVEILGRAARAGLLRVVERVAVADAEPVVHRQHDEAAAGEVLVRGVVVGVVVHVVKAEQHLPRRAAVHVDERRPACFAAGGLEQLRVNLQRRRST